MPRKKTKKQFRRGIEQKYQKHALYSSSQESSSNVHFPYFPFLIFSCFAGLVIAGVLFRTTLLALVQLPTLPEITAPPVTLPQITLPKVTITLPDFSAMRTTVSTFFQHTLVQLQHMVLDAITVSFSWLNNGFLTIRNVCIAGYIAVISIDLQPAEELFTTFARMIINSITSAISFSTVYLNPWIIVQKSIAWERLFCTLYYQYFSITIVWLSKQFVIVSNIQSTLFITVVQKIIYFSAIAISGIIVGITTALAFLGSVGESIGHTLSTILNAIGTGIGTGYKIIAVRVNSVVAFLCPIVSYISDTFALTLRELGSGIVKVFGTMGDLASTYHESTKNF